MLKAFASYTLLNAIVNLVTRRGFGEKVGCCASSLQKLYAPTPGTDPAYSPCAAGLLKVEWHGLQVSHVIAPAVLAVYALNLSRISVMDTATLLFGYFLAEKLDPPSLFWGFIATLVAAVFYGYGALLPAAYRHNLPLHGACRSLPTPLQSRKWHHQDTDNHP